MSPEQHDASSGWDPEETPREAAVEESGFLAFLWENKLWWGIPFVLILAGLLALLWLASDDPFIPFFYALTD